MSAPKVRVVGGRMQYESAADVAFSVGMMSNPGYPAELRQHCLEEIQSIAERRLKRACARIGININDLPTDESALMILQIIVERPEATAADKQAFKLMQACVEARLEGLNDFNKAEIVAAFAGLDADFLKFRGQGKSPDAVGQWLDAALQRQPKATTADLWVLLCKKPPRGYIVESDSFGGTLYRRKPWAEACTRPQWRDRVRRARERMETTAKK